METRIYNMRWFAALLLTFIVMGCPLMASEISASASLSYEQTTVGEAVELNVTVDGVRTSKAPEIRVDGLHIQYAGPQSRIEMNNFNVTSSVTHTYIVIPQRAGTFTIPALKLDVGGKSLSTRPVKLVVQGAGGAGAAPNASGRGARVKRQSLTRIFASRLPSGSFRRRPPMWARRCLPSCAFTWLPRSG
jgi:hypothetical protein